MGPARALSDDDEASLVSYLLYMSDHGVPLTRPMIKAVAREIISRVGQPMKAHMNKQTGPSDKWIKKFITRHRELAGMCTFHTVT